MLPKSSKLLARNSHRTLVSTEYEVCQVVQVLSRGKILIGIDSELHRVFMDIHFIVITTFSFLPKSRSCHILHLISLGTSFRTQRIHSLNLGAFRQAEVEDRRGQELTHAGVEVGKPPESNPAGPKSQKIPFGKPGGHLAIWMFNRFLHSDMMNLTHHSNSFCTFKP